MTYQFQNLDVAGAAEGTTAYGINDAGIVVGAYTFGYPPNPPNGDPYTQAFIRAPDGSLTSLATNPYGQPSYGYDINNLGQMAGYSGHYQESGRGFIRGPSGTYTRIEYPGDNAYTRAFGINGNGAVVGVATPFGPPYPPDPPTSLEWKNGQVVDTFAIPGVDGTSANDIANWGLVVGTYTVGSEQHGFAALNGHAMWGIDVPGSVSTDIHGISENGSEIVGSFTGADGVHHGFVDLANHFSQVDVPGAVNTFIYGVNNAGQVVGSYTTDPSDNTPHAFEATPLDPEQCIVDQDYLAAFGREADTGGLNYWAGLLKAGVTPKQLAQDLAGSAEFQSMHGQQSNRDYVEGLYANALGRQADAGGGTWWSNAIASGTMSRSDVMASIAQSAEGQQHFAASHAG